MAGSGVIGVTRRYRIRSIRRGKRRSKQQAETHSKQRPSDRHSTGECKHSRGVRADLREVRDEEVRRVDGAAPANL
jgi:hypothetical protein